MAPHLSPKEIDLLMKLAAKGAIVSRTPPTDPDPLAIDESVDLRESMNLICTRWWEVQLKISWNSVENQLKMHLKNSWKYDSLQNMSISFACIRDKQSKKAIQVVKKGCTCTFCSYSAESCIFNCFSTVFSTDFQLIFNWQSWGTFCWDSCWALVVPPAPKQIIWNDVLVVVKAFECVRLSRGRWRI